MNFFQEISQYILGGVTPAYFVSTVLFVFFGALITILFDVYTRSENSKRTPETFSWSFFWRDNRFRFALNILIAIAVIRFFGDITGMHLNMFWAFACGLVFDGMLIIYKKLRKTIKSRLNVVLRETE